MRPFHQPSPRLPLLLAQYRQEAKNHWDTGVELHTHETVGGGVGDVLKVHGFTFYEDADGDDGVEWGVGSVVQARGGGCSDAGGGGNAVG